MVEEYNSNKQTNSQIDVFSESKISFFGGMDESKCHYNEQAQLDSSRMYEISDPNRVSKSYLSGFWAF